MNKILMLAAFLFSMNLFAVAGEKPVIPTPFEFVVSDSVSGSQAELFSRANVWLATHYDKAQEVIQYSDVKAGKIIGKANANLPWIYGNRTMNEYVRYTITIIVKDGKYQCKLSDFRHLRSEPTTAPMSQGNLENEHPNPGGLMLQKVWKHIKEEAVKESWHILDGFQIAMKTAD